MKTIMGISQSTLSKFLKFQFGDKFIMCNLKKARNEFHIIISNEVPDEEIKRWIDHWRDEEDVTLKFLRVHDEISN